MAQKAHDLCTTAAVAADLGIASDSTVERVVSAVSRAIAQHCGRTFEKGTVTEYPRSGGRPRLLLSRPPVVSITSITELGGVVDAADYMVECSDVTRDQGLVLHLSRPWRVVGRFDGLITQTPGSYVGQSGDQGITAVYVGGFVTPGQNVLDAVTYPTVTLPEDVQEAAIQASVNLYRRRGIDQNLASESLGDWSVSYRGALPDFISSEVAAMLAPYVLARVV